MFLPKEKHRNILLEYNSEQDRYNLIHTHTHTLGTAILSFIEIKAACPLFNGSECINDMGNEHLGH